MTWLTLLLAFLQIGFFSIGGGYATIPLIQEQVVDKYHWLSMQEFTDIITISQMTPGPLAVNTSTFTGIRIMGIPGAVLATFGCIISGFVICLCLYCFFSKYKSAGPVFTVLKGLRAASIGLIAASAGTILAGVSRTRRRLSPDGLPQHRGHVPLRNFLSAVRFP